MTEKWKRHARDVSRRYLVVAAALLLALVWWVVGAESQDEIPITRILEVKPVGDSEARWIFYSETGTELWPQSGTFILTHWDTVEGHVITKYRVTLSAYVEYDSDREYEQQ